MKILVTGAAGFIGFHLSKKLITLGMDVTGLDNLNNYYDPGLKLARLHELGIGSLPAPDNQVKSDKFPNFHFYATGLEDQYLTTIFNDHSFDVVVNLAAQAGVRYSMQNPSAYLKSNINGFFNILEACKRHQVGHLVYASSSSVYGMNKKMPFSTKDNVDHPISFYAATKKANELMAHSYSYNYGLPVTGLRFFTVYGPWGRPDMAPYLFTHSILQGKPITVFNNGVLKRDFTYVEDIVEGIVRVIPNIPQPKELNGNPEADESSAPYKIYNIGNSEPVDVMAFIRLIEKFTGRQAIIQYAPLQPG
ncbi:MAG: NAD-dependent epimerase/dehydratase family protein, partial [Cytophagales bacterium]|nr:NAD-dependent epimerase/dehydratase family protein [Cytophagales bacterium]